MSLNLMYITNDDEVAKIAESSGVDWIFVDLEINGKEKRQGHLDTVISQHSINDVKKISNSITKSKLLVRINPIYENTKEEIKKVIKDGADIVMLPFFKEKSEVASFIQYVNGDAETCLLLETPEAVENLDSILEVEGIDYIHIGLNDMHLGYKLEFMFELLVDGTVEKICDKIRVHDIPYGFGGIAQLGRGELPAEDILGEHYRLESKMAILSRSFCDLNKIKDIKEIKKIFTEGIAEIRKYEEELLNKNPSYFIENKKKIKKKVLNIVKQK